MTIKKTDLRMKSCILSTSRRCLKLINLKTLRTSNSIWSTSADLQTTMGNGTSSSYRLALSVWRKWTPQPVGCSSACSLRLMAGTLLAVRAKYWMRMTSKLLERMGNLMSRSLLDWTKFIGHSLSRSASYAETKVISSNPKETQGRVRPRRRRAPWVARSAITNKICGFA
jgi:hypothetical protein